MDIQSLETENQAFSLDEEIQTVTMFELVVNGTSYMLEKKALIWSNFIKDILEFSKDETKIVIELPQKITDPKQTMDSVIQFILYHEQHPVSRMQLPLVSDKLTDSGVSQWDSDDISKSDQEIVNLSQAAHYLHIPDLQKLCCAKIGSIMKNIVKQFPTKQQQIDALKQRWNGKV